MTTGFSARARHIVYAGATGFLLALPSFSFAQSSTQAASDIDALKKIPLEDLFKLEVTTVSKSRETLSESPSAIQVITAEDIRRSGASSLPEALRLASNLQVAQVDSHSWAISARGFNSTTADKLLVMIDGRRLYTPLFNGVFWDVQNVMLEDIDRIEVVSGPGASVWGANAVNGVINVVTKSARDTQGGLVTGEGGSFLNGAGSVRYGDKIGKDLYFRLYALGFARDNTVLPSGIDATNNWHLTQGGFRADWLPPQGEIVTFQGDFYGGEIAQPANGEMNVNGQNVLGRWTHPISDGSDFTLQLHWDRTWRRFPGLLAEELNNYDLDFQHRFPIGERNKFLWGAGYRLMADDVGNSPAIGFFPEKRNLQLFSGFLQDEVALVEDKLFLTVGSKFENNDYSGFEVEPGARLAWRIIPKQTVWAAVSRAVRAPSRIDTDFYFAAPGIKLVGGGDMFTSEKVVAYELGYRTEVSQRVSASISTFYNRYDDLRSIEPVPGNPGEAIILNGMRAETYGVELSATWQAMDFWRLRGGYTFFKKNLDANGDLNGGASEGNDPHHQFVLQSMVDLPAHFEFDSVLRYVDNLDQPGPTVPGYVALDLRVAWRPKPNWEIAIIGQNLTDDQHPEIRKLTRHLAGNSAEHLRKGHVEILAHAFSRFCFLALLLLELSAAEGLAQASREYQVKAVCLWRLAQYVQWPTNTFANTNSPIVIGVLGDNPFGNALQLAVQNEKAQGHPLRVEYFDRVQEALGANILFISRSESRRVLEDIAALDHRSILTVSDIDNFVREDHGMVRIYIDQGKLRLRASPEAAAAARLTI